MFRNHRIWLVLFVLILFVMVLSTMGIAANPSIPQSALDKFKSCHQVDPVKIANDYLDRMQVAYVTKNLSQFINLYNDPVVALDVVNNMNELYSRELLNEEVGGMFQVFSGISCIFEDRKITFEGDMIMVRAMRSFSANEIPFIAKCDMIMVLRQPINHRQPWNFVATDQIMMSEEYIPKSSTSSPSMNTLAAPQQKTNLPKTNHLFW